MTSWFRSSTSTPIGISEVTSPTWGDKLLQRTVKNREINRKSWVMRLVTALSVLTETYDVDYVSSAMVDGAHHNGKQSILNLIEEFIRGYADDETNALIMNQLANAGLTGYIFFTKIDVSDFRQDVQYEIRWDGQESADRKFVNHRNDTADIYIGFGRTVETEQAPVATENIAVTTTATQEALANE